MNLSWSQPNYVVNTPVNYQVQVGIVDDGGTIKWDVDDNGANNNGADNGANNGNN